MLLQSAVNCFHLIWFDSVGYKGKIASENSWLINGNKRACFGFRIDGNREFRVCFLFLSRMFTSICVYRVCVLPLSLSPSLHLLLNVLVQWIHRSFCLIFDASIHQLAASLFRIRIKPIMVFRFRLTPPSNELKVSLVRVPVVIGKLVEMAPYISTFVAGSS